MQRAIHAVLLAGRAAWPAIPLDAAALAAHFQAHAHAGAGDAIPVEHAADMYLACACALGIPEATRALDQILRRDVAAAVARIEAHRPFVDEALQALRTKLLVGDPPKIATYAGLSSLRRWLGTAAVRTALNLRRTRRGARTQTLESTLGEEVARGPELAYAHVRYRAAFEEGLRVALGALTDRERELLRMNVVDGVGIDRLAREYGCGRSTVARWLNAARDKLLLGIREHLRSELALSASEVESLAAVVRSGVDVSIARLLGR